MGKLKRVAFTVLAFAYLLEGRPSTVQALSLFGGKKKTESANKDAGKTEKSRLPGMPDAEGVDLSQPPRMAQETEAAVASPDGSLPTEVVIKGQGAGKVDVKKSPLNLQLDPFESIRESLKSDQQLLLAESPLTVVWRRTHPEFLKHPRVIQPWRTVFSQRPGIAFRPRDQLLDALQRKMEDKELKNYPWSLTIADEEGKVFQHYEGSGRPPEELLWSGQNDQEEWIRAGSAYSPVYMFTDPSGTPYTRVGKPLRFNGIVHQERTGIHLSLDSEAIFGTNKTSSKLDADGEGLLRAAADLIKRRYMGIPIRIEVHASSKQLAESQAQLIKDYLGRELMVLTQEIATEEFQAPFSDQRVEIILLNR